MFSTRSHLLGMGLQVAKNMNRSIIMKTAVTRKVTCSYFSVKVDIEGEIMSPAQGNKSLQPQKVLEVTDMKRNLQGPVPPNYQRYFQGEQTPVVLIHRLKALTKSTMRDSLAIQNVCNKLLNTELDCNVKDCVDLLFCLSVLNVHDEQLLVKLLKVLNYLLSEIYKPSPLILCISKSMRNLLLRNTELLNGLISWFLARGQNLPNLEVSEAADLIQTLAMLNYFPAEAEILLKQIMNQDMAEYTSSTNYLNFAWAVTLIDRIQPEIAESVMAPHFRKKLESILAPGMRTSAYLKLINIQANANLRKLKIETDGTWYTAENTLFGGIGIKQKRLKDAAVRNFIDCLANVMPIRTFNTFVETESGCVIDAVCFFDSDHKPITELESMKNKNGIKLAMMFLQFKDLCLPGKQVPTGIIEFHKRYLESSNYKVLYVPFNEYPYQESLRKKSEYITKKIKSVLPKYEYQAQMVKKSSME